MQPDNNLVLYADPYNEDPALRAAAWATDTDNRTDEMLTLRLGEDGTLALVDTEGAPAHEIWPAFDPVSPSRVLCQ
jgi:hypothetical protein